VFAHSLGYINFSTPQSSLFLITQHLQLFPINYELPWHICGWVWSRADEKDALGPEVLVLSCLQITAEKITQKYDDSVS
jgi:hypothetical protein